MHYDVMPPWRIRLSAHSFQLVLGRFYVLIRRTGIKAPLAWTRFDRSSRLSFVLGWPWRWKLGLAVHVWFDRPYRADAKMYDDRYRDLPHDSKISSAWCTA